MSMSIRSPRLKYRSVLSLPLSSARLCTSKYRIRAANQHAIFASPSPNGSPHRIAPWFTFSNRFASRVAQRPDAARSPLKSP
jgi:hypothetical protein